MKIKYFLLDNPMTSDPNDRRAQVVDYEVIPPVAGSGNQMLTGRVIKNGDADSRKVEAKLK